MSLPDWVKRNWASPAALLLLFGAVTWGVQHNFMFIKHSEEIAELRAVDREVLTKLSAMQDTQLEIGIILKRVVEDHKELHEAAKLHQIESFQMKERLIQLEARTP